MLLPLGLQTALISASTAAAVTLVIEYAAKPRLEIRKDRLVTIAKSKRELEVHLLMTLNHPSLRLIETENPQAVSFDTVKERLSELCASLEIAERSAENLFSLGLRDKFSRGISNNITTVHEAIKTHYEALQDESDWSATRKALLEASFLIHGCVVMCRPAWHMTFLRSRSRAARFRRFRIESVTNKRYDSIKELPKQR